MNLAVFFFNLLFPPRCVSCRGFLAKNILDPCTVPLCDKCRLAWEKEKTETCSRCGAELLLCRCGTGRTEKAGIQTSVKLIHYRVGKYTVGRRVVLYLKKNRDRRAFRFFAEQLSFPIRRLMKERGLSCEEVCFCYVPRTDKRAGTYGLDHAEALCKVLANCLGGEVIPLFYRVGSGNTMQKTLSENEREQNVKQCFAVDEKEWQKIPEAIKCIFLVDDVVTTGASIAACATLLKGRYEGETVAVSLAKTPLLRRRRVDKGMKIGIKI